MDVDAIPSIDQSAETAVPPDLGLNTATSPEPTTAEPTTAEESTLVPFGRPDAVPDVSSLPFLIVSNSNPFVLLQIINMELAAKSRKAAQRWIDNVDKSLLV